MKKTHPAHLDHHGLANDILAGDPLLGERIAEATSLSREDAPFMLAEVLKFLHLITWSEKTLSPPFVLDLAWHELILFTRLYATVCRNRFGRFIHHQPGGSESQNRKQLGTTLKLYALYFGPPPERFWGTHGYLSEAASCGACEGNL